MSAVEQGWSVMRQTMCKVGMHVWLWTGTEDAPQPQARCDCDALSWAQHSSVPAQEPQ